MKICRKLTHLITPLVFCAMSAAQTDVPPGRILNLDLDPQTVTTVELRPGFVTSIRLPEVVNSVVVGDPGAFKAEHSEAEPQLVFFKPSTQNPSRTNALITTRAGREIALTLVSQGVSDRAPIDYVLRYGRTRSVVIDAARPSFLVEETSGLDGTKLLDTATQHPSADPEEELLSEQQKAVPRWEGGQLRASVGRSKKRGDDMTIAFSVLNSSSRTMELGLAAVMNVVGHFVGGSPVCP